MGFESFPKSLKETLGVPDAVVDLLLNEVWVEDRPDVFLLGSELVEGGLERGRSNG